MRKKIRQIIHFFSVGLWRIDRKDVSPVRYFLYSVTKGVYMAIELATTKRMIDLAAALTYSTLLAIVPILAVVFAIARGFGYNKYIEIWFLDAFKSQPQAAEVIVGFVNSYLLHTKSGVFIGFGLVFMLYTVLMLVSNVERAFNGIWHVKKPRSIGSEDRSVSTMSQPRGDGSGFSSCSPRVSRSLWPPWPANSRRSNCWRQRCVCSSTSFLTC